MKKFTMMWALLATVLLSVVGCNEPEPEVQKPTISVAEAVVDAETMTASVEVTPSTTAASWSWKVDTAEAAGEYTKVNGNAKTTVTVDVEYDTEYTFTAYATNAAGNSQEVSVTFNGPEAPVVTPGAASIEVSDVEVRAETLKAIVTVTPSEETAKWYYALYEATLAEVVPTYNEVEGNELTTLTLDIEAGKTYTFSAYAVNEAGEACDAVAKTFTAPAADEEVSGNGELVKLELKNITSLSVDADVQKYKECVRYVAGAVFSEAYNENRFITAAKSSLNPNSSYPYVQYNSATTSKVWTEMDLVKNGLATKEGNTGIQIISGMSYTVAVYAEDAEGNYKVYAEQFTAPAAEINGNVDLKMNIDNIGMTDITATFTADTECRIIAGTRLAVNTQDAGFDANNMTDEEIKAFLVANAASVPTMFYGNQTIHFTHDMGIDTDYIVYAIAIKDGKVGNVVYEKFHTKRPELTGSAAFTSATFEEQTDLYALNYTLTTNADAAKVRIFFTTKVDYNNNKATLDFIMISEDAAYMWDEFEVVDGQVVVESEVYTPGDQYAVYGVAFDAEGNPGALTNLVKLWNAEQDFYQTKAEDEVASAVDMTGTGVVTMTVKEGGVTDEVAAAVVTVNTKSDNVAKAWLMSFNEVYEKDILTEVEANLQGWNAEEGTESIIGAVKEITFAEGEEFAYESLIPYDNSWGGSVVAVVVLDTDGKFSVSDYYLAGTGDKNVASTPALEVTGEAILNVKELVNNEGMVNVKTQVTKIAESFEFGWIVRFSEIKESELSDKILAGIKEYGSTGQISGAVVEEVAFGVVKEYNYLTAYDAEWGGSILAVVGMDNAGNITLADYYVAGTGDKGTVVEGGGDEPSQPGTEVYTGLYKGATLAVGAEDVTDPTAASATVKVAGVGSAKTYILRMQGAPSALASMVAEAFADYDGTIDSVSGAVKEVTAEGQEFSYEYMEAYDAQWADYAYNIVVVEVHNNTPYVVAAYCPGAGVANGDQEIGQGGGTDDPVVGAPAMVVASEDLSDESSASATLTVSGLAEGQNAWLLNLGSEALIENVESDVAALFEDGDEPYASEMGAYRKVANGDYTFNYMFAYDAKWGGNIVALVTVEGGVPTVVSYYVCGQGVTTVGGGSATVEAPAMAVVADKAGAGDGFVTLTVSNLPAEGTAWLLNLGDSAQPNEVSSMVASLFDGEEPTASELGAYRIVEAGKEYTFNYLMEYDANWGGHIIAFAIVKNGVPTVYSYYVSGVGLSDVEQGGGEEEGEDIGFGGNTPSYGGIGNGVAVGGGTPSVE